MSDERLCLCKSGTLRRIEERERDRKKKRRDFLYCRIRARGIEESQV